MALPAKNRRRLSQAHGYASVNRLLTIPYPGLCAYRRRSRGRDRASLMWRSSGRTITASMAEVELRARGVVPKRRKADMSVRDFVQRLCVLLCSLAMAVFTRGLWRIERAAAGEPAREAPAPPLSEPIQFDTPEADGTCRPASCL